MRRYGQSVLPVDLVHPQRAHAPLHGAVPLLQGVILALVEDVRVHGLDHVLDRVVRLRHLDPDLVFVGSIDGSPAEQTRVARHRRGHRRRDYVEPVVGAPRRDMPTAEERTNSRVERVRRAGDPGKRERGSGDRRLEVRDVVEDAALPERLTRRELELIAQRPAHRLPRERRRPVESRRLRLVRHEEEAVQAGRRCNGGRRRAGEGAGYDRGKEAEEERQARDPHHPVGCRQLAGA